MSCLDFNRTGSHLASGATDGGLRVYATTNTPQGLTALSSASASTLDLKVGGWVVGWLGGGRKGGVRMSSRVRPVVVGGWVGGWVASSLFLLYQSHPPTHLPTFLLPLYRATKKPCFN